MSRLFVALIGLSVSIGSFAMCHSDTLIVDGEIVQVEPREVKINIDSLQRTMRDDFRKRLTPIRYTVALSVGSMMHSATSVSDGAGGLQPLDVFLSQTNQYLARPFVEWETSLRISGRWSIATGVGLTQWRLRWLSAEPGSLYPDDQRFRFENRDAELWQYVLVPIGIGFEVDTFQVELNTSSFTSNLLSVPLAVRADLRTGISPGSIRISVDAGVRFWKSFGQSVQGTDRCNILSNDGRLVTSSINMAPFQSISLTPFVQAFIAKPLSPGWALRIQTGAWFHPRELSVNDSWQLRRAGVSLSVAVAFTPGDRAKSRKH